MADFADLSLNHSATGPYFLSTGRDSNPRWSFDFSFAGCCLRRSNHLDILSDWRISKSHFQCPYEYPSYQNGSIQSVFVGMAGNDPTTSKVSASRSDHLSYIPVWGQGGIRTHGGIFFTGLTAQTFRPLKQPVHLRELPVTIRSLRVNSSLFFQWTKFPFDIRVGVEPTFPHLR